MTADAFRRLALLLIASAWAAGLAACWVFLSPWVGLAGLLVGPLVAVLATVEASPAEKAAELRYPEGSLVERDGRMQPLRRGRPPAEVDGA